MSGTDAPLKSGERAVVAVPSRLSNPNVEASPNSGEAALLIYKPPAKLECTFEGLRYIFEDLKS
jgi:hypothetical protein